MDTFYVRTHLGLGDMILCNGLLRNICKIKKDVVTFSKPEYCESVKFMYRDVRNLKILCLTNNEIDNILNTVAEKNKVWIGYGNIENLLSVFRFDECFYKQIGLNFERRWTDFYLERNKQAEKDLMNRYRLTTNEYIFVHDDASRGYIIPDNKLPENIKIFRPEKNEPNIFNYCTIIENAKQIHVMDSCFKHIADSLNLTNELFYHVYIRGTGNHYVTNSKHKWRYIF